MGSWAGGTRQPNDNAVASRKSAPPPSSAGSLRARMQESTENANFRGHAILDCRDDARLTARFGAVDLADTDDLVVGRSQREVELAVARDFAAVSLCIAGVAL